jgi:preprotein translocase subunit SecD
VAGLIVAIGITADSFIVYFERIKDELRDGRGLVSSVEQGWKRALRTIIASDTVNFLAAAVLFILAVGNVKGFALTLGLTTIIDLIVVSLFTHPILQLLANRPFFAEGHRMSGLDPRALGAVYRGRATFRTPTATAGRNAAAAKEAARRQTIAERKAAQGQATGSTKTATIDAPRADDTSRDD